MMYLIRDSVRAFVFFQSPQVILICSQSCEHCPNPTEQVRVLPSSHVLPHPCAHPSWLWQCLPIDLLHMENTYLCFETQFQGIFPDSSVPDSSFPVWARSFLPKSHCLLCLTLPEHLSHWILTIYTTSKRWWSCEGDTVGWYFIITTPGSSTVGHPLDDSITVCWLNEWMNEW